LKSIEDILEHESISDEGRRLLLARLEELEKERTAQEFLIERLSKNDEISKRFLNDTIKQLEDKNFELSKYIESNMQLENFAHIASHDLKAPLVNIISFAQLLIENLSDLKGRVEYKFIENIESSAMHMHETIQALLRFSQASNAKLHLDPINISKLLEELLNDLDEHIKQQGALVKIEDLPASITGDKLLLKEVFHNLIINGIKFTKANTPAKIIIDGDEDSLFWYYRVRDNGIGIHKDFTEKIFLIFKRLHSAKKYAGTGIGLPLCKSIIENHGGKIWAESEPDIGSTFHFSIAKK
jgi:light-regulated signal transduction histidine kinase (bacteriophytochrome)